MTIKPPRRATCDYEVEGSLQCAVLYRDREDGPCDLCPFCGAKHWHGRPDGHRAAHCSNKRRSLSVVTIDGTELFAGDGVIVRTRGGMYTPEPHRAAR